MKIETLEYLETLSQKYNTDFNIVLRYWYEDIFTVEDKLKENIIKN